MVNGLDNDTVLDGADNCALGRQQQPVGVSLGVHRAMWFLREVSGRAAKQAQV